MKSGVPGGRFRRAFDMARVGARAGASWATARGNEAAAKKTAEVLGNLRGIAAKVGQTASYVDGLIPPEQREVYEKALSKLQSATPPSSFEDVDQTLVDEFGKGALQIFASFDIEPIASASIGQVHRAVLHDGTAVAVKVQHTGIEEAVESDLKNISMLEGIVDLAGPRGMKAGPLFNEVVLRFRQELDYRIEAKNQKAFRLLHDDHEDIHIPQVYDEYSTRRVLTTRFVEGFTLAEARTAPEPLRRRYAQAMWRFVFRGNLVGGAFNADPHPGNYIFDNTGRVTFLDFGCVQPIFDTTRLAAVDAHMAIINEDQAGFERAVAQMLGTRGGQFGAAALAYSRLCFEPLTRPSYRLTSKYATDLFSEVRVMKKSMTAKDGSFVTPPPQLALMNRLQFGFYSVLAQLDVEANYQEVELGFLEEARSLAKGKVSSLLFGPT